MGRIGIIYKNTLEAVRLSDLAIPCLEAFHMSVGTRDGFDIVLVYHALLGQFLETMVSLYMYQHVTTPIYVACHVLDLAFPTRHGGEPKVTGCQSLLWLDHHLI